MLPLFLFCFWLQIYHYFCSWTAVAGSFGCHFGGFFSCSATLLSKISTPLETCVGQKLILIQMRPTCYSPVLSFMYIFFIICLQKHARSFARVCKLQCACRESNPGHKRGRLVCCRYTTGALVHEIFLDLLVLFSFLKALRANPLMGLPLTSCILLFCFPLSSDFKPGVSVPFASVNWLFGLVA